MGAGHDGSYVPGKRATADIKVQSTVYPRTHPREMVLFIPKLSVLYTV